MTNGNYIRHFKVLGKLCKLYDDANANSTAEGELLATFADQYSDGTEASLAAISLFPAYTSQWASSINNGASNLANIAINAAAAYLVNATFTDDLTTTPTTGTAAASLVALATDMGAGVDNKTLGTKTTSGLVNFFDAIAGESGTWNTESDATADYRDAVYVVSTVV